MPYSSQQDLEQRIGTAQLTQLTNDTWGATPPQTVAVAPVSGGSLSVEEFYVVTALNSKGETIASSEVNFTPGGGNNSALLTWAAVAQATSYKIYRSMTSGVYTSPCLLTATTLLTFTDTGSIETLLTGSPPPNASMPDSTIVSAMIAKADAEIDSIAGQVWVTPFIPGLPTPGANCVTLPNAIKQISIDMSLYFCFLRRYSSSDVSKEWVKVYGDAKDKLQKIGDLESKLDGSPTMLRPEIKVSFSPKMFTFGCPNTRTGQF